MTMQNLSGMPVSKVVRQYGIEVGAGDRSSAERNVVITLPVSFRDASTQWRRRTEHRRACGGVDHRPTTTSGSWARRTTSLPNSCCRRGTVSSHNYRSLFSNRKKLLAKCGQIGISLIWEIFLTIETLTLFDRPLPLLTLAGNNTPQS